MERLIIQYKNVMCLAEARKTVLNQDSGTYDFYSILTFIELHMSQIKIKLESIEFLNLLQSSDMLIVLVLCCY